MQKSSALKASLFLAFTKDWRSTLCAHASFARFVSRACMTYKELCELLMHLSAGEFKPDVIQFVDPIWLCAQ